MQKLCVSIVVRLLVSIVAQAKKNLSTVMVIGIPNASGFAFAAGAGFDHNDDDCFPARAFQIDLAELIALAAGHNQIALAAQKALRNPASSSCMVDRRDRCCWDGTIATTTATRMR